MKGGRASVPLTVPSTEAKPRNRPPRITLPANLAKEANDAGNHPSRGRSGLRCRPWSAGQYLVERLWHLKGDHPPHTHGMVTAQRWLVSIVRYVVRGKGIQPWHSALQL